MLWLSNNSWHEVNNKKTNLTNARYIYGSTINPDDRPIYEKQLNFENNLNTINNKEIKKH